MPFMMPSVISRLLLLATYLLLSSAIYAGEDVVSPAFPKEGYPINIGDTSEIIWMSADYKFGQQRPSEYFYQLRNSETGESTKLNLPTDFLVNSVVQTTNGLMFLGEASVHPVVSNPPSILKLLTPQGRLFSVDLPLIRKSSHLLALFDQSALVIGGDEVGKRSNAVERISLNGGSLVVERLPDFPGVKRTSYALVALADGRAMVLGGSDSQYTGCMSCLADTYILDPKTKEWGDGPNMLEPRADATATLLPDGSVLVAGGWLPKNGWSEGATRSTERWEAHSNRFTVSAPLPIGVAMHQTRWASGQQGKQLLLAGGMLRAWEGNEVGLLYDVANNEWQIVGEDCQASSQNGRLKVGSLVNQKQLYMWCEADFQKYKYIALREPHAGALRLGDEKNGFALHRSGWAFLPQNDDWPALVIGGDVNYSTTSTVDAIWADGRVQSIAPLNRPRRDGHAFRLLDGVLVTGGTGDGPSNQPNKPSATTIEWLSLKPDMSQSRWIELNADFDGNAFWGQMADGNLIAVHSDGSVELIAIENVSKDKTNIQRIPLPALNRNRSHSYSGYAENVHVKGLQDGRIVVAGGSVQVNNIAVLQEDSMQPDALDRYIGVGEHLPSRRYEIYDPLKQAWSNSAPSRGAGGSVAILDNGRVVKLKVSKILGEKKDGTWAIEDGLLEISDADGKAWNSFNAKEPSLVKLDDHASLFVIQGELFLSGESEAVSTGGGASIVQWFNTSALQWETLWEAASGENWRVHVGRIISRTLANGKRVTLPVRGM